MAYDEKELDEGVNVAQEHYENTFGRQAGSGNSASEDMLRDAESGGVSDDGARAGARDFGSSAEQSQRRAEERAGFKTRVTGKPRNAKEALAKGSQNLKRKRAKILGNFAPIIAIIAALFGLGGGAIFGQMFMPFGLDAQIHDNFNSMRTASTLRSKTFMKLQMDGVRVKDVVQSKIFGTDKFKISPRQEAKFKQNGIEVDRDYEINGKKTTVLKHIDSTGKMTIAVADDSLVGGNVFHIDDLYNNDVSFRNDYFNGAKTWRGAIYQWYDTKTAKLFDKLHLSRHTWDGYKPTNDNDVDEVSKRIDADDPNIEGGMRDHVVDPGDENTDPSITMGDGEIKTNSSMDVNAKRLAFAEKLSTRVDKLSKGADAANLVCVAADVIGVGSLIAAAMVTASVLAVAIPTFEGIEATKVGDGDSSPTTTIASQLATPTKTQFVKDYDYNGGDEDVEMMEVEGAPMDASPVGAMFGREAVDYNDPSVKALQPIGRLGTISKLIGLSKETFLTCTAAKATAALMSAAGNAIQIAACFLGAAFTGGLSCASLASDLMLDFAASIGISGIISAVMSVFMPFMMEFLSANVTESYSGVLLGSALVAGGSIIMGSNHRYGGGAVANMKSLISYSFYHEKVLADNARHDRETRSPFDITSPNTFMGSLANKLIPVTFSSNKFGGSVSAIAKVASNSFKDLSPTSYAMETTNMVTETAKSTAENCPFLDSIGAVGDAFCNPVVITDVTTIEEDPADVVTGLVKSGQLEDKEGDIPTIVEDSDLANHIIYCGERQSQFGIVDQNIASSFDPQTGSSTGDTILGATPIVGDLVDVMGQLERAKKMPYITGEACVIGNEDTDNIYSTPEWEESKEFQRFIEDQRLAESAGLVEKSAVSVFLDKYHEEHPIDDSFEGILAELTGVTKENIIATFDNMEYLAQIAEYDPIGRLPLQENEPVVEPIEQMKNGDGMEVPSMLGLFKQPLYFQEKREFAIEA